MQVQVAALLLASFTMVLATPVALENRQSKATYNEVKNGPCKAVTFVMARGSTEGGNMGSIVGGPTCESLKKKMGDDKVACQGIGTEDGYAAALAPNFQAKNTDAQSIAGATKIINMAMTKCPDTTMVLGGYSQGSAVIDNAVQGMDKQKIAGVVMFGYTRNAQDKAQIPGYPKAQTKIFCAAGDQVCNNSLTITAAHLSYGANADEAATFLASMAQAAGTPTKTAAVAKMEAEFASANAVVKARSI